MNMNRAILKIFAFSLATGTALSVPVLGLAAEWTGAAGDSQFGTAGNWDTNAVPAAPQRVEFGSTAGYAVDFGGQAFSVSSLFGFTNAGSFFSGTLEVENVVLTGDMDFNDTTILKLTTGANLLISPGATLTTYGELISSDGAVIAGGGVVQIEGPAIPNGTNQGTVTGGMIVRDGTMKLAYAKVSGNVDVETAGTVNIDREGSVGSLSGVGTVSLYNPGNMSTGNLTIGTDNSDRTFSGLLTGTGTLTKDGTGTQVLNGTSTLTGAVNVVGGTLQVDSDMRSTSGFGVISPGTLGGNGSVSEINNFGAIAPGTANTIGTLSSNAAVTFQAGSFFDVDVAANGASDKLIAQTAVLNGGVVRVRPLPGLYALSTDYTILETANGLTGTFDSALTNDLAFLTPTLSYNGNQVLMRLERIPTAGPQFGSVAQTYNQGQSAVGIDGLSAGNTLYDALLVQTFDNARNALNQVSPETYASIDSAFIENGAAQRNAMLSQARKGSNAVTAGGQVMSYQDVDGTGHSLSANDTSIWGSAYGAYSDFHGNGNAAALTSSTGGFQAGADGWFDSFRVGVMFDAGASGFNIADRNFSAKSVDYGVGVYGGTNLGATHFAFGAGYQRHDVKSTRVVAFPGFSETLSGIYYAGTGQIFGEISHDVEVGEIDVTPFAQVSYVDVSSAAFDETGGTTALNVDAKSNRALLTQLGLRIEHDFYLTDEMQVKATAGLAWQHAFVSDPAVSGSLLGSPAFSARGVSLAKDALILNAGLEAEIGTSASASLRYGGQLGSAEINHQIAAKLTFRF